MRYLLLLLMLLSPALAGAVEVGSASEAKMARLLEGCWQREMTPLEQRLERHGLTSTHELCFGPEGKLGMWSLGSSKHNAEGYEASGRYELSSGKLILSGEMADGWFFDRQVVACDMLLSPDRAVKLQHCTGGDTRAAIREATLEDSSYAFVEPDCWSRGTTVICLDNAGWVTTYYSGVTETFDFGGTYIESGSRIRFDAGGAVGEGWVWDDAVVDCTRDRDSANLVLKDCTVPNRSGEVSFELDKQH